MIIFVSRVCLLA